MTPHEKIKLKLRVSALLANKQVTDLQVETAAQYLEKRAHIKKSDLEFIGESVANDRIVFASTDVDEINDLLDSLGNK